jgi:hypothetical protein
LVRRVAGKSSPSYKILWLSVATFAISGILPWFVVNFPIGNLKISILDLMWYFYDSKGVEIDFYSAIIYEFLLSGWIFSLLFLIGTAILKKRSLVLLSAALSILPSFIWIFVVPNLRIQMIFLSLSNQPIGSNQTIGSGEIVAIMAGAIAMYSYIRLRI